MATIPSASVSISAEAGTLAGGTGYCVVFACVERNADLTPRVYTSAKSLLAQHGYSPGVDYSALHIEATRKPIIFVALPTVTPGVVGRQDASGVTGTSVISVAAGAYGFLEETDTILTVVSGGTVGTDDIRLSLSCDGGVTEKLIRLGTASSYTVPYLGIVISFGAGMLVAEDEYAFTTTAPKWDASGIAAARFALSAQQKPARSWMIIGDLATDTEAGYITTAVNGYETAKKRFVFARANVRDRLPTAEMARVTVRMTGSPTLTFAEVGATGDTITRSAGSWITDGFAVGDTVTVAGSASNNVTGPIASLSATVITLGSTDLAAEGPVANCSVVGTHTLTFAEVGGTGDTITRSGGSWLDDGVRAGDVISVLGTASNNIVDAVVTNVTATVITLGSTDLAAEVIGSSGVTLTAGETMAEWVSAMDAEFASVDAQKRISLGLGRLRKLSPITAWEFRRPVQWAASIREYQHDIHHPTWTKEDGPLDGWSMDDENNNVVEYDEDNDGGALAGRFTCARTWGNGPNGAFIAMDLTRDVEGSLLSYTHNMAVANVCCTIVQTGTENFVGKTPRLNSDGTAESAALQVFEESLNTDLQQALLREFVPGEGPRASLVVWRASTDDVLNVVDATMTGAADLEVNGTIVHVETDVKVR
jgi:hypothetical protein